MGRSLIGFGALVGMTLGGFLPEVWGASDFSLGSLLFSVVGGIAGVWLTGRLAADL